MQPPRPVPAWHELPTPCVPAQPPTRNPKRLAAVLLAGLLGGLTLGACDLTFECHGVDAAGLALCTCIATGDACGRPGLPGCLECPAPGGAAVLR